MKQRFLNQGSTIVITNDVQRNFFSKQDVMDGKAAPPFDILAMLEVPVGEESPVTLSMCCGTVSANGVSKDKCIAVVGVNADAELEVVEYCIPARLEIGVHEHMRWNVSGSSVWTSSVRDVSFASRETLVVTLQDRVNMYQMDGSPVVVLQQSPPEVVIDGTYAKRLHQITGVFVAPSNYMIIDGFQYRTDSVYSVHAEVRVALRDWRGVFPRPFFNTRSSTSDLRQQTTQHVRTCLGFLCEKLLLLPTSQQATMRLCTPDMNFKFSCVDAAPDPDLALRLGLEQTDGVHFLMAQDGTTVRRLPVLAQNTLDDNWPSILTQQQIFSSNPTSTRVMWDSMRRSAVV